MWSPTSIKFLKSENLTLLSSWSNKHFDRLIMTCRRSNSLTMSRKMRFFPTTRFDRTRPQMLMSLVSSSSLRKASRKSGTDMRSARCSRRGWLSG